MTTTSIILVIIIGIVWVVNMIVGITLAVAVRIKEPPVLWMVLNWGGLVAAALVLLAGSTI